ncbi:hypothetical protein HDV00_010300 [Rhizophlyctis rosea]|nr:hypothetical protein HDV00_010300 [Rhizophlyctis rosea]
MLKRNELAISIRLLFSMADALLPENAWKGILRVRRVWMTLAAALALPLATIALEMDVEWCWVQTGAKAGALIALPEPNSLGKTICGRHCRAGELRVRPTFGGDNEKRDGPENPLYKTRLCERFMKEGFCQYGPRCNFAHSPTELRDRPNHGKEGDAEHPPREQHMERRPPNSREASPQRRQPPRIESPPIEPKEVKQKEKEILQPAPKPTPAPAPASPAPHAPTPVRTRTNDKVSLKDLLKPEDSNKDKTWMRVVEISDDEKEKLASRKRDVTSAQQAAEDKYIAELHQKFSEITDTKDQIKEITRLEFRHDLSKQQLFNVVIPAYFEDGYTTAKLFAGVKVFKEFLRSTQDQLLFLRSWEKALSRNPKLLAKAALVFKDLYDKDLVEEEQFVKWGGSELKNEDVKKRVGPFLEWLQTAEEEED